MFGDYQCPYTAKAWPTLTKDLPALIQPSDLRVRYHLFEILHHHSAYDAAKAAYITTKIMAAQGKDVFVNVSTMLFNNQEQFYNGVTANITRLKVRNILSA